VKLFLDTSVMLSACASPKGASRYIVEEAKAMDWALVSAYYCREETKRNLHKLGEDAMTYFSSHLDRRIDWRLETLAADAIVIYNKAKDKPVLISALSITPDVLLTLDRADFHDRLGSQFYGIAIRTPGEWLTEQREAGLI